MVFSRVWLLLYLLQLKSSSEKKIVYDKTTQQFSIKIPRSIALKAGIREDSVFDIIFNPKESKERIQKAKFVIYLKEGKDGEGEKTA